MISKLGGADIFLRIVNGIRQRLLIRVMNQIVYTTSKEST